MKIEVPVKIKLDNGSKITLTYDEAIELKNKLNELFGDKIQYTPYYPSYPYYTYEDTTPYYTYENTSTGSAYIKFGDY